MRRACLFALCVAAALAVALPLAADDKKDDGKKEGGGMASMPVPKEMEQIAGMVGEWKVDLTILPGAMSPKGSHATGTLVVKKSLGDQWLACEYATKEDSGAAMYGHEMLGFDPRSSKFSYYWFDSAMSGYASHGMGDCSGDTLTMDSEEEMQPGKKTTMRLTEKFVGKDRIEWALSFKQGDNWAPAMTATYTRAK